MTDTTSVVPDDVLEDASRAVSAAQNGRLKQFLQSNLRTGEIYLFILSSNKNLGLINELPHGFLYEGETDGPRVMNGQKICTVLLSNLPYVVFKVVDHIQSATS